jgi:hypothetical protein
MSNWKYANKAGTVVSRVNQDGSGESAFIEAIADWLAHGNVPEPAFSKLELQQQAADAKAANIGALWRAAHDYEYQFINGMAIGLLTIGVIQGRPIAVAIRNWSNELWRLYYDRKPLVTDMVDEELLDFSEIGPMPHSVPELMLDLGFS